MRANAAILPTDDAAAVRGLTGTQADVAARLDRLPATSYLWYLVVVLAVGAFFEIYDLTLSGPLGLGLTTVGIFHRGQAGFFGLTDQATFVASTFAGLYFGVVAFSVVADRFGRRPVFSVALLAYSFATIIMGFQHDALSVDVWRFVASIGAGIEMVAIDCYLTELMPGAFRGRAFAICASIQYLAAPFAGGLAWMLIPGDFLGIQGWRWLTFVPAVGAVLIWFIRRELPESPRWLAAHGRPGEADRILLKIEARVAAQAVLPHPVAAASGHKVADLEKSTFAALWTGRLRRRTIALVIFHLFQVIGYFGFSNWLPTLLVSQGITVPRSLGYSATIALVSPMAPLLFFLFADKVERKWLIVTGALVAAGFGLLMTQMTQHSNIVLFTAIGAMVAAGTSLMSLSYHTYQSEIFPTALRGRAVGFVYSFSRLSAMATSFLIAAVLDNFGSTGVFLLISSAMVIVALTIGILGPRSLNQPIDAI